MSKRMMTKLSSFAFALAMTFTIASDVTNTTLTHQAKLLKSCMAMKSNLPMNHNNHPCNATYHTNQSWWSWASSDSQSVHLHFLDLVELMHLTFN